jgi:hypothetical protein
MTHLFYLLHRTPPKHSGNFSRRGAASLYPGLVLSFFQSLNSRILLSKHYALF